MVNQANSPDIFLLLRDRRLRNRVVGRQRTQSLATIDADRQAPNAENERGLAMGSCLVQVFANRRKRNKGSGDFHDQAMVTETP